MLRILRENTGGWIIKIFLGIIVVVFVFLGVGTMNSSRNNSVASVNDEPISVSEFQDAYSNLVARMRERFQDNLTDELLKALNVKQQALNSLIEERLVTAQADKFEIIVSDEELESSILAIDAFHKNGRFDMEQYRRVLGLNSMTPEMFEQLHRSALRQKKIQDIIFGSVFVSDLEAREFYLFNNTRMAVDYISVSPEEFTDISSKPEQIQAHYTENREQYQSEPGRKAAFIKFSPKDYRDQVTITPAQVKEYYEQNPDEFKIPERIEASHIFIKVDDTAGDQMVEKAREQANAVYQRAVAGEDFAELARGTSEGPSREDGGYLGIFDRSSMIEPFADRAFSMKPGEISEPVRTRFGWHVIKAMNRFDAQVKTLEETASEIETRLVEQEIQNLAYNRASDAFDTVIDGDTLEQVALIIQKQVRNTDRFDRNGKGLDLERAPEFARIAFSLEEQQISDLEQIGNDYFLIKVVETIDPYQLPIEDVKDRIAETLGRELRIAAAQSRARELLEAVKTSDETLDRLATEKNLTLSSTKLFTRNDSIQGIGRSAGFSGAAFSLSREKPLFPEVIETSQGFHIISFKDKQVPGPDEIEQNLADIRQQLLQVKQGKYYQAWVNELKEKSRIEINPQFFN